MQNSKNPFIKIHTKKEEEVERQLTDVCCSVASVECVNWRGVVLRGCKVHARRPLAVPDNVSPPLVNEEVMSFTSSCQLACSYLSVVSSALVRAAVHYPSYRFMYFKKL